MHTYARGNVPRLDGAGRTRIFEVPMSDSTRAPSGVSYVKAPSRDQVSDNKPVEALVSEILKNVRERGDAAVREYSEKFDKSTLSVFEVTEDKHEAALRELAPQTRQDTEFAIANVRGGAGARRGAGRPRGGGARPGGHRG